MPDLATRSVGPSLAANQNGIGSHDAHTLLTEWTPESTSTVPIRSSWRDAIGKRLNNAIITRRQRQGFYGAVAQKRAQSKITQNTGIVHRCACNRTDGVVWYAYKYLPKPAWNCPHCIARYRAEHNKEQNEKQAFALLMERKYV